MSKRLLRVLIITTLVMIIGIAFTKFGGNEGYSQDNIRAELDRFVEVFIYVKKYYVETVESDKLITGAIEGLLSKLDPHSVYIPKKSLEKVTEQFTGHFEGIGIEFIVLNKVLTVVSPIVGGPAEEVGLLPGDQIIRIDDKSAYGITEDEVMQTLRGPKGTKVKVTIARPNLTESFDVVITRDKIPIYSVYASFILDDNKTGYIWLARFAKTTSDELETALKNLEAQGMKQLILDLRYNSGGLLEQAVEVSDKFLPGGHKIVYTRGRIPAADEDFYSTNTYAHPRIPMIIMINHGSASASEIVAGALQDLDRGLVVGQRSFGKGLVQNQIGLKDGSAIRLTVARYYTPSGRLIQRPYDNGLMDYYAEAYSDEEPADSKEDSSRIEYKTLNGRIVYGGGGITPDSTLKPERVTRFTNELVGKRILFELASKYVADHPRRWSNFKEFRNRFAVDDELIDELKALVKKNDMEFSEEAYQKDARYIKMLIKAEVARNYWDSTHYYMLLRYEDTELASTVPLMSQAESILELGGW
ncbi:S41 family peptidase [candidate division KSB1 bacterium]|nr:S41 family peptidase [candidate division KSB1 bacterium]